VVAFYERFVPNTLGSLADKDRIVELCMWWLMNWFVMDQSTHS